MKRQTQLLNGWWDYRIADGKYSKKYVPYSDLAVGISECKLNFNRENTDKFKRAFLVFDGINSSPLDKHRKLTFGMMMLPVRKRPLRHTGMEGSDYRIAVIIVQSKIPVSHILPLFIK